jgi:hypothetical protein
MITRISLRRLNANKDRKNKQNILVIKTKNHWLSNLLTCLKITFLYKKKTDKKEI